MVSLPPDKSAFWQRINVIFGNVAMELMLVKQHITTPCTKNQPSFSQGKQTRRMRNFTSFIYIFFFACILPACDSKPGAPARTTDASVRTEGDFTENPSAKDFANNNTSDNGCSSLSPLLKLLPTVKNVDGLPETYRGCESAGAVHNAHVYYSNSGDKYTEYKFSVFILDGKSPYLEAFINIPGATEDEKNYLRNGVSAVGNMYKAQLVLCNEYFKNPIKPADRNPIITIVQDIEVCIIDNMDANKEIWNAFAIYNNLGIKLEFQGTKAAGVLTTATAKTHLVPLFSLFNFK